jgi:hypothetical protein
MMDEDLEFKLEIWDERGNIERLLARFAVVMVARGAFEIALREYPDRRLTLRHGARVICEHPKHVR